MGLCLYIFKISLPKHNSNLCFEYPVILDFLMQTLFLAITKDTQIYFWNFGPLLQLFPYLTYQTFKISECLFSIDRVKQVSLYEVILLSS